MLEIIRTENLCKSYQNGGIEIEVIKGVDITVNEGEFVSIMGPSGCGKSTLLYLLGGIDVPTSGKVLLNNQDINKMSDKQKSEMRRKFIGFVFQFYNLVQNLTVAENILLPLTMDGKKSNQYKNELEEILEIVGLTERRNFTPRELSGGQQQRVAIARSLIHQPLILLADEPTGNLDTKTTLEIMELIKNTQKELNQTIVLVTHNPIVSSYADRVIYFKDGKLFDDELVDVNKVEAINHISEKLNQISGGVIYDK